MIIRLWHIDYSHSE